VTTKTHALVDGRCRPLVIACTPGQAGDSPALPLLLAELRVPRCGPGRPRTTPDALLADKAYSARAHRQELRSRGITAVIPEPADQIGHRKNRGSRGGRPVTFDADRYRGRNVVERGFNRLKNWRGLATRYDKHVVHYRGGMVLGAALLWL
jgi:putative transposase